METEPGIVAPSFSQGQEAGFDASDFGMDNFPDDDDFPMDDGYDEPMNTDNPDNNPAGGAGGMGDIGQSVNYTGSVQHGTSNDMTSYTDNRVSDTVQGFTGSSSNSKIFQKDGVGNAGMEGGDYPMSDNYSQYHQTGVDFTNQNLDTGQGYGENKVQSAFEGGGGNVDMDQDNTTAGETGGDLFTPEDDDFLNQLDDDDDEGNNPEGKNELLIFVSNKCKQIKNI